MVNGQAGGWTSFYIFYNQYSSYWMSWVVFISHRVGIKDIKGVKRLSGPGLDIKEMAGIQQGGGKWPWRWEVVMVVLLMMHGCYPSKYLPQHEVLLMSCKSLLLYWPTTLLNMYQTKQMLSLWDKQEQFWCVNIFTTIISKTFILCKLYLINL